MTVLLSILTPRFLPPSSVYLISFLLLPCASARGNTMRERRCKSSSSPITEQLRDSRRDCLEMYRRNGSPNMRDLLGENVKKLNFLFF